MQRGLIYGEAYPHLPDDSLDSSLSHFESPPFLSNVHTVGSLGNTFIFWKDLRQEDIIEKQSSS